ncbi:MAG: WGR domain-containing protein [Archangium sp.]|nr:WGR domain-containing protein [Archangium sp.]
MSKRYFEFSEGSSNKFWEVWIDGNKLMTRYGKIGAGGQTTVKDEGSPAGAQKLYDKLIREKTGKGYQEKGGGGGGAAPAAAPAPAAKKAAPAAAPAAPAAASTTTVEPGFRRFEFSEGTSNKFWEVKVEGEQQIVRFGKIGTAGQVKEKDFDSAGDAKADTKKLIAEKTGKGYVEVGVKKTPSNPSVEAAIAADQDDTKNWRVFADWLIEQGEAWGETISRAVQGKPDKAKQTATAKELLGSLEGEIEWKNGVISHLGLQPEDVEMAGEYLTNLEKILKHPAGHYARSLTLGMPPDEDTNWHMEGVIEAICSAGPLPFLETLDLSKDAESMDQPSWRRVGDLSGIWAAAPHLKELLLQGSAGSDDGDPIVWGDIEAPHLEKLIFISGGLSKAAPIGIGKANLPKLNHLELYFGAEDYGNDGSVKDLKGILDGTTLPALKTLGLKNSPWEKDLITAIAGSKILPRLKVLDLSMGVLASEGALAIEANAAKFKHLERLVLVDNYLSDEDGKKLKKLLPNAEVGDQKDDEDPEYRYTSIAE